MRNYFIENSGPRVGSQTPIKESGCHVWLEVSVSVHFFFHYLILVHKGLSRRELKGARQSPPTESNFFSNNCLISNKFTVDRSHTKSNSSAAVEDALASEFKKNPAYILRSSCGCNDCRHLHYSSGASL